MRNAEREAKYPSDRTVEGNKSETKWEARYGRGQRACASTSSIQPPLPPANQTSIIAAKKYPGKKIQDMQELL